MATQPAEHNLHPQTSPLPCSPPNPTHTLLPVGGPSFATRRANRGISPLRESTRWPSPDRLCAPATAGGDGSASSIIFAPVSSLRFAAPEHTCRLPASHMICSRVCFVVSVVFRLNEQPINAIRPSQQPLLRGWGWQTAGSSPAFRQWRCQLSGLATGARCQGWLRPPLHLRQPCPCRTWAPPA